MNHNQTRSLRVLLLALGLAAGAALAAPPAVSAAEGLSGVVNVNTATAEELAVLPGIGEAKARAIVDAREARGGFRSVDELVEVKGIGDAALTRIRPYVALQGRSTLRSE